MKLTLLCVALWATLAGVHSSDVCDALGVYYCSDCWNPPLLCYDCYSGTVLEADNSGCRDCGIDGCHECVINGDNTITCIECLGPYILLDDGSTCEGCSDNCGECSYADTVRSCDTCYERYVKSMTNLDNCIACGSNCAACSADASDVTSCTTCDTGYMKDSSSGVTKCVSCPSNCDVCSLDTDGKTKICTTCSTNKYKNDDSTKCISCPSNCKTCQDGASTASPSSAQCTECMGGYYLNEEEFPSCGTCVDNCDSCTDASSCDDCMERYYINSGGTCTKCPFMCEECSVDDSGVVTCDVCLDEYALKDTALKTCDPCPSNCFECTPSLAAEGKCTTCDVGYYKDSSKKCMSCPSNCDECSASSGSVCDTTGCKTDYIRDDNGVCQKCADNCVTTSCSYNTTLNEASCTGCDSYYAAKDDIECVECIGCQYCRYSSSADTYRCKCSDTVTDGDTTDSGTYDHVLRGGCATSTISYVCDEGYYLASKDINSVTVDQCEPCDIEGCIHCNNTGASIECLDCDINQNYAAMPMDDGTCYACSDITNCLYCDYDSTNGGQCTACKTGYEVYTDDNGDKICKACGSLCASCNLNSADGSAGSCSTCKDYGVKNSELDTACLPCSSACLACVEDGDGGTTCNSCPTPGYALNGDSECEACGDNCVDCEYDTDASSVVCKAGSCEDYYGLFEDGTCGECAIDCTECSLVYASDGSTDGVLYCDTCATDYTINGLPCTPCPSQCTECDVDSSGSVKGTKAAKYYRTDDTDGSCTKCPTSCQTCTATSCSVCDDGYGVSADRKSCVDCATLSKVQQCNMCEDARSDGNATCLSCGAGYLLSDNSSYCNQTSLLVNCKRSEDHSPECRTCEDDNSRYLDDDLQLCVIECYACGTLDYEGRTIVGESAVCNPEDGNYTTFPKEKCLRGHCGTIVQKDPISSIITAAVRGCEIIGYLNTTCEAELMNYSEEADENNPNDNGPSACQEADDGGEFCADCCTGDACNDYYFAAAGITYVSLTLMALVLSLPFM